MKVRRFRSKPVLQISNGVEVLAIDRRSKYSRRTIDRVAYRWGATVEDYRLDIKVARLRDSYGRLLFVSEINEEA